MNNQASDRMTCDTSSSKTLTGARKHDRGRLAVVTRREFLRLSQRVGLVSTASLLSVCQPPSIASRGAHVSASQTPNSFDFQRRLEQAYQYLEAEMDRWSDGTVVYDDQDSGGAGFSPTNKMGDIEDILLDGGSTDTPVAGSTCLKITYTPRGKKGWAGIYIVYPDHNWGEKPGRDLSGATQIQGWIRGTTGEEFVELKIGGINRPPHHDPSKPYQDSFETSSGLFPLGKEWRLFTISIPKDTDLTHVIGGFVLVVSGAYNPEGCTVYLDAVSYNNTNLNNADPDNANPNGLRLIRSYRPTAALEDRVFRNAAFLYDNALALLAFLARGDAEGKRRAQLLADAIVWAQNHDRVHHDGRLRNAYMCGPLRDPVTDTARLPGWYDVQRGEWIEDRYAVSSDTGNTAWAMIALLAAQTVLQPDHTKYLGAAIRAGEWIADNFRVNDDLGGYTGGCEGWGKSKTNPDGPRKVEWRSTEHAIDLYVAFSQLAAATGDDTWKERALHARKFYLGMWNPEGQHFWTGVRDRQGTLNTDAIPSDPQTWAVLAMGHDGEFRRTISWAGPPEVPACLGWVERQETCRIESQAGCPNVAGYRFSDKGTGVWFEGSAHLAAAYRYLGDTGRAKMILEEMMRANPVSDSGTSGIPGAPVPPGGIYAGCPHPVKTGFLKEFAPGVVEPWTYPRRLHIGATAWFLFAMRGVSPYWLNGPPSATL